RIQLDFQRITLADEGQMTDDSQVQVAEGPFEVKARETAWLYFKLKESQSPPETGAYKALLVLTAPDRSKTEATITIHVPSQKLAAPQNYWEAFIARLQQSSRSWSKRIFGLGLDIDLATVVTCLILLVILIGLVSRVVRRHDPGTVTIEAIKNATGDSSIQVDALTAQMRDLLNDLGLDPPGGQPASSIKTQIKNIITKTAVAAPILKYLTDIYDIFMDLIFARIGYTASTTLCAEGKAYKLILEIKNTSGNIEAVDTLLADSPEKVAKKAAYQIYRHAVGHPRIWKNTPPWARFHSTEAFGNYQEGKRTKDAGQALLCYQKAAQEELNNVIVRLPIGSLLTTQKKYLEAMEAYIKIVLRWPTLLEPRYRLAAVFSFEEELADQWKDAQQKNQVKALLEQFIQEDPSIPKSGPVKQEIEGLFAKIDDPDSQKMLWLHLAILQYNRLVAQAYWSTLAGEWLATLNPFDWQAGQRSYLAPLARPWPAGSQRRTYQRVIALAKICTQLQLKNSELDALRTAVDSIVCPNPRLFWRRWKWWGMNWQARYNGVCFYALAMSAFVQQEGDTDPAVRQKELANLAVDQLEKVIRDPQSWSIKGWLFDDKKGDPDLKALREHDQYKNWERLVRPEPVKQPELPDETIALAQGWELVAHAANLRIRGWKAHQSGASLWTGLDQRHLDQVQRWYLGERNLWKAAGDLARSPADEKARKLLWDAILADQGSSEKQPALQAQGNPKQLLAYQQSWKALAERAASLQKKWDGLEDRIRHARDSARPAHYTPRRINDQLEKTIETWEALEAWAGSPLDKPLQDQFKKTAR
ncbi:MAG: hypothetical protein AB1894_28530, partial [Chloroflexota bacterium]